VTIDAAPFHPHTRSTAGSLPSPIPVGATSPQMITFTTPGFYPYFCSVHGGEFGGMYGVIHVVLGP
jgi:plastocyanin